VVQRVGDRPAGFVVDRMSRVVAAESDEIEDARPSAHAASGLLRGVVKREGEGLVQLLDPGAADRARSAAVGAPARAGHALPGPGMPRTSKAVEDACRRRHPARQLHRGGRGIRLPIGEVQEIVQLPAGDARAAGPPEVVGVMTLRERLLPLVSLRRLFGLEEGEPDDRQRILVVCPEGTGGSSVGIVMDQVKEVLRVPKDLIEPVPPLLADGGEPGMEGICRLAEGRRLVTVLSARRMFGDAALRAAVAAAAGSGAAQEDAMSEDTQAASAAMEEDEQVVVFRLAGEEYAVPIDAVQEIVRVPEALTHIPRTPDFIEGVVNLRGAVLPVVDQRRRFALPALERNDRQRIMVLQIGGLRTGFIVDQVLEVLRIRRDAIERAPHLSDAQARLIRRVANLPAQRRMVLLIDAADLLEAREIQALEAA
jgi:purine-binding chemotaxis protein CheW